MIAAAVYARKSNEQKVSDEAKSVTRQIEHATAYAERKGWTVNAEHVFQDDAISGAEFVKRPGFVRLMATLNAPPFQVLVMSEESRLGRESIETAWHLKQITDAGIRVYTYLDDEEVTLATVMDKMQFSMQALFAEAEREKGRARQRDTMHRKAKRGEVCGGRVYGYTNLPILGPSGVRSHVERRIHEPAAAIVRRIFTMAADGVGISRIAKALNAEAIPSPNHARGWATSGVRSILHRELYVGRFVYGRRNKQYRKGTRRQINAPLEKVIRLDQPALRIIEPTLWATAHAQLAAAREHYVKTNKKNGTVGVWVRPPGQFLLSGLLECAACKGHLQVVKRVGRRGPEFPYRYYLCANYRQAHTCRNRLSVPLPRLHEAIIEQLQKVMLNPTVITEIVEGTLERRAQIRKDATGQRATLEAELARLQVEVRRTAEAIATGGPMPALLDALQSRERRRQEITDQLVLLDAAPPRARDAAALRATLTAKLDDWKSLLERHPAQARATVLGPLLDGQIVMTPEVTVAGRFYRFTAPLSWDRFLTGLVGAAGAVVSLQSTPHRGISARPRWG